MKKIFLLLLISCFTRSLALAQDTLRDGRVLEPLLEVTIGGGLSDGDNPLVIEVKGGVAVGGKWIFGGGVNFGILDSFDEFMGVPLFVGYRLQEYWFDARLYGGPIFDPYGNERRLGSRSFKMGYELGAEVVLRLRLTRKGLYLFNSGGVVSHNYPEPTSFGSSPGLRFDTPHIRLRTGLSF